MRAAPFGRYGFRQGGASALGRRDSKVSKTWHHGRRPSHAPLLQGCLRGRPYPAEGQCIGASASRCLPAEDAQIASSGAAALSGERSLVRASRRYTPAVCLPAQVREETAHPELRPLSLLPAQSSALLALADGSHFIGSSVGAVGRTVGEVVFNTAMSGYQEILTDPSYRRQLVTLTCPHVGDTGSTMKTSIRAGSRRGADRPTCRRGAELRARRRWPNTFARSDVALSGVIHVADDRCATMGAERTAS